MRTTTYLIRCLAIVMCSSVWSANEPAVSVRTLIWSDGTRYVGGVINDKREGKGTIYWQDGTRFSGYFQNDKKNGPGTMVLPDGSVRNGYFKDDVLVPSSQLSASMESASESTTEVMTESEKTSMSAPPTIEAEQTRTEVEAESEAETELADTLPQNEIARLKATLDQWADAWSKQDTDSYLGFYAANHVPSGDLDREKWASLRRQRIEKPDFILVNLEYEQIELLEADLAQVALKQKYQSSTFEDMTEKIFRLKKVENDWKIQSERSR